MSAYINILRYELFGLFISPATYVSTFYFLCLLGIGFRFFLQAFAGTDWILPPLSSLILGLTFGAPAIVPFLTMRTFAEERKLGTLETLMSAPVSTTGLVLGKWSASLIFFFAISALATFYPLLLWFGFPTQAESLGFTDIEKWIGGGAFLLAIGSSFTAVGIFASSLTNNQMVAGMLTFTLLTLYLSAMTLAYGEYDHLANPSNVKEFFQTCLGSISQGLTKAQHFAVGVIDLQTLLHQVVLTFLFLSLAILKIERYHH